MDSIGVGSTIWIFDINRRVYAEDANGRPHGSPIWREHWLEATIADETSRSWVVEPFGRKISKKNPPDTVCFSQQELDDRVWVMDNQWRLGDFVSRGKLSISQLQQIAEIAGYTPV